MLNCAGDGLFVVNLRSALVNLYAELPAETVDDDVEVKLTHAADDGLASLWIGLNLESRILLSKLAESDAKFVKVALSLRLNGNTDHWIREHHWLKNYRMFLVANRIAGTQVFETYGRRNVTCLNELDRILMIGVHLIQTWYSFILSGARIVDIWACIHLSRVASQVSQASYERIRRNLEH